MESRMFSLLNFACLQTATLENLFSIEHFLNLKKEVSEGAYSHCAPLL